eukprot:TRINITY_DN1629_c3_g1_i1.p1 TRINITY_DN1629_c3_g1~~TRINITY_DN1629_c3_g1_i1.p1  ORF type:complete len:380 (-),score=48.60 TRINITY_DN1629_c3_g1_i1:596-1675(-)
MNEIDYIPQSFTKKTSFTSLVEEEKKVASSPFLEFQKKLHERVCNVLLQNSKLGNSTASKESMNILFNELTCRIDPSLANRLQITTPRRYYEILANYYLSNPGKFQDLEELDMVLWDNQSFQMVMSMIMYLWIFSHNTTRKQFNSFIKCVQRLFWLDIENSTRRFLPIFKHLYVDVLSSPLQWSLSVQNIILEIFSIVSQYYFYYNRDFTYTSLARFLSEMQETFEAYRPNLEIPNNHHKIHTLHMFANEVVRQMKNLRHEDVIITYINSCQVFRGALEIVGKKTRIRLQSLLLDYSTPGCPLYPTRPIREIALQANNILFPVAYSLFYLPSSSIWVTLFCFQDYFFFVNSSCVVSYMW